MSKSIFPFITTLVGASTLVLFGFSLGHSLAQPAYSPPPSSSIEQISSLNDKSLIEEQELKHSEDTLQSINIVQSLAAHRFNEITKQAIKEAQVSHLASKYKKSIPLVQEIVELAWEHSDSTVGVTPEVILSVIQKESSLRPEIKNSYGAMGLMQVVPRWHPDKVKNPATLLSPATNVRVGAQILKEYVAYTKGDLPKALVRYSGNARNYAPFVIEHSKELSELSYVEYEEFSKKSPQVCVIKTMDAAQYG